MLLYFLKHTPAVGPTGNDFFHLGKRFVDELGAAQERLTTSIYKATLHTTRLTA